MGRASICGVGINDADYVVKIKQELDRVDGKRKQKLIWSCPYYQTWKAMITRCYSVAFHKKYPTYKDCTVCEEWKHFSNFKSWMEQQEWQGKELDKDVLVKDNKLYGPDTCIFIYRKTNCFIRESEASRGDYMIGVSWNKLTQTFMARCSNPFTGKQEGLGYFVSEKEAHLAWLKRKLDLAVELAVLENNPKLTEALIGRYKNYDGVEDAE